MAFIVDVENRETSIEKRAARKEYTLEFIFKLDIL
jgi:hypothetical protein